MPAIAKRHGSEGIQGIWLGTNTEKNRAEIETAVKLANDYPDVMRALVVGNEVLLRGDLAADDLAATIRAVKAQVKVPVTYADVWEYWLSNRAGRGHGRFRHHPYFAVLGGLSDCRPRKPPRMSTRSAAAWWPRLPART